MKKELELTISSIQIQEFRKLFPIQEGFKKGTIFKELDRPFKGGKDELRE